MEFSCAHPRTVGRNNRRKQLRHARPYQVAVQSHIRNLRPNRTDTELLLGYDEVGLVAVCEYRVHPDGDQIPGHFIKTFARDNRAYGTEVAQELLTETLSRLRAHATHEWVLCRIEQDNRASRRFFKKNGFEIVRHDGSPQLWGRPLELERTAPVDIPAAFGGSGESGVRGEADLSEAVQPRVSDAPK